MVNFNINTKKKRKAFEVLVFIITFFISITVYFVGNYFEDLSFQKKNYSYQLISSRIDSLNNSVFRNRYKNLEKYDDIKDYSYNAYKKNILNDPDSSFRRMIYYRLCRNISQYRNEKTFEEFLNQFEYESINKMDEQLLILEQENNEIPTKGDFHLVLILIIIIIMYPLRYFYYLIKWSINTLKEINNDQSELQLNKDENSLNEQNNVALVKNDPIVKSKFINYFTFNNEYLTGISYLNRIIIGWITSIIFGVGLYLMLTTAYKRSKSLGYGNNFSVIISILIPSLFIITLFLNFLEKTELEQSDENIYKSILIRLLLGLPHMILLFKNGTRKKNGEFRVKNS
jgi:hypothetical protein